MHYRESVLHVSEETYLSRSQLKFMMVHILALKRQIPNNNYLELKIAYKVLQIIIIAVSPTFDDERIMYDIIPNSDQSFNKNGKY